MTREEAINEIKSWDFLEGKEIEAIQTLIPELEENEDEKIIMTINNILPFIHDEAYTNNGTTKKDVLNWLEKQKEYIADNRKASTSYDDRIRKAIIKSIEEDSSVYEQEVSKEQMIAYLEKQKDTDKAIEAVERIDKYIDEHVANAHDMKDSNPDKKYYRGWDDALGKMAGILQDVYSGEKQKEQKPCWNPTEEDVALFNKAITTNTSLSPQERAKLDILRMKFKHCPVIEQKEQKSAEWSKEDESFLDSIEEAIHSYYDLNHAPQYDYWLEEKLKSLRPQPKQEWNEEDEKIYQTVFNHFNSYEKYSCSTGVKKEHILSWLKSLKHYWKPSKEQMNVLFNAGNGNYLNGTHMQILRDLYNDLKKLM